ncbi:MBL fold metallo-hydrolase [Acholeplasma hippikon]|nr:MBL fold metallo-hydrolase [Acholeplasma hippikon]
MEIFVLASGSKGNMTYVKENNFTFFIDAGITYSKMVAKMKAYGEDEQNVHTLFLTHEHQDHIAGLKTLLKQGQIKEVFLTKGTYQALSNEIKELLPQIYIIKADEDFFVKDMKVTPIMLSHDAFEPVGFIFINKEQKKVVLLTDTGYVDQSYIEPISDADLYILESNHDPKKLLNSSRPFSLKQRILGVTGHLSNDDAASIINKAVKSKKAVWIVAHISDDCNDIFDIEKAIVEHIDDPLKIEVLYASQESLAGIKI